MQIGSSDIWLNVLPSPSIGTESSSGVNPLIVLKPPSHLPVCQWHRNSCSLDVAMILHAKIRLELPKICAAVSGCDDHLLLFSTFGTAIGEWLKEGPWESWSEMKFTECRDSLLRTGLGPTRKIIEVSANSAVEDILNIFIPPALSQINAIFVYHCTTKGKCSTDGFLIYLLWNGFGTDFGSQPNWLTTVA